MIKEFAPICALLFLVQLAAAEKAMAQLLSPGKLGKGHASLEGVGNCTKCHDMGKKVDGELCLECHKEIDHLIENNRGFHAKALKSGKVCMNCHKDHRGENAELSEWDVPKERFDHKRTGYPLVDKHGIQCAKCHQQSRVDDPGLRKRFQNGGVTYLGLSTTCSSCHFDEHRGQFGNDCERCHDFKGFKPVVRFKHDDKWVIDGAHLKVECIKCHLREPDPVTEERTPAPVDPKAFVRYKWPQKRLCKDCHRDVHVDKFGRSCDRCHTTTDWIGTKVSKTKPTFHNRTRYPLVGKHIEAACNDCHPSKPGGKGIKTKGVPFAHCNDCHIDPHFGQIAKAADGAVPCQKCHDEEGFFPTLYPEADHQKSRYPLTGAHASVACNACHKPDPDGFAELVPKRLQGAGPVKKRTDLLNFTRFKFPDKILDACESCHKDPHGGQFVRSPAKSCSICHSIASFKNELFVHNRDSSFKLEQKHQKAACNACHHIDVRGVVVYRGIGSSCVNCHVDIHAGQFADPVSKLVRCEQCHDNNLFKPAKFSHADPKQVNFQLRGRHEKLSCDKCHPKLTTDDNKNVIWYRGVPSRCDGCHVDVHRKGTP